METKKAGKEETLLDFEEVILSNKNDSALWNFIEFSKDDIKIGEPAPSAKEWKRLQLASDSTSIPISIKQQELNARLKYGYTRLLQGIVSIREFWEQLREALMDLYDNAAKYGASPETRDEIGELLDRISTNMQMLDEARMHGGKDYYQYEQEVRLLFREALDLIQHSRSRPSPV